MEVILAILAVAAVSVFGVLFFYYKAYRCFPWQKHLIAEVNGRCGSVQGTFKQQYEWHESNHSIMIRDTTTSLTFESFKTFYELNPEAWEIQEGDFGASNMYFQVVYCNGKERIRIIFNKSDFQKYRKWLAQRAIEREKEAQRKDKIHDLECCQRIVESIKQDIIKKQDQAQSEIEQAKKITEDVKENLKWVRYEKPVIVHTDKGVVEVLNVWRKSFDVDD